MCADGWPVTLPLLWMMPFVVSMCHRAPNSGSTLRTGLLWKVEPSDASEQVLLSIEARLIDETGARMACVTGSLR